MTFSKDLILNNPSLGEWNIYHCYRGSIAHGNYCPSSDPDSIDDKDTMALCVPTKEYYMGLKTFGSHGTKEIKKNEWDVVAYEARKGISLLSKGNPNILSMLWVNPRFHINLTPAGQLLLSHRRLFVGKHVYRSFSGYAYSQLHKMESFKTDNAYMGKKRKELVTRFGYDCKNASHLIRLLRMGIEFLTDGELYVEREDAAQLLDIKKGRWTLEQVKAESDRLFNLVQEAYIHSKLPEHLDYDAINQLCVDIIETAWQERK
jgi:predicted nucleotidyltransferase